MRSASIVECAREVRIGRLSLPGDLALPDQAEALIASLESDPT